MNKEDQIAIHGHQRVLLFDLEFPNLQLPNLQEKESNPTQIIQPPMKLWDLTSGARN